MGTAENWTVTVWGTRGAIPTAGADFLEYGGNTSCISVCCGGELVVFDAGTGIAQLDAAGLRAACPNTDRPDTAEPAAHLNTTQPGAAPPAAQPVKHVHLFLSHLHLDHVQGLIGFPLLQDPSAELHLYGEARDGMGLRAWLDRLFGPPYWPVSLDDSRAGITIREIGPDTQFSPAPGLSVRTLRSCHPNQSLIYRLDGPGRSIVYTPDCELTDDIAPRLTDFARGCDLLVWDANFSEADLQKGWGHSTWQQGLAIARAAGAARVLMTHYDRSYTDAFLARQEHLAKQESNQCVFAREGMEIVL